MTSQPWPTISPGAKDLIRKLLVRDPDKRLTASEVSLFLPPPLCLFLPCFPTGTCSNRATTAHLCDRCTTDKFDELICVCACAGKGGGAGAALGVDDTIHHYHLRMCISHVWLTLLSDYVSRQVQASCCGSGNVVSPPLKFVASLHLVSKLVWRFASSHRELFSWQYSIPELNVRQWIFSNARCCHPNLAGLFRFSVCVLGQWPPLARLLFDSIKRASLFSSPGGQVGPS
jgi:hypothetical protein